MNRLLLICITLFLFSCNNEKSEPWVPGDKKETTAAIPSGEVKLHSCNEGCEGDNHNFFHTEIGHTCSTDCGRPHVCGEGCSGPTHVYAHGEAGHYCMCPPTR